MSVDIDMGAESGGTAVSLDLEELLATRLLVQGNSGSGKSHLLRRLLEQSAPWVQQVVIDPEGDFVSLSERFGHAVVEAADYSEAEVTAIAQRVRERRASVVLNLEGLDVDAQLRTAAVFLSGLFDAPRERWYPVLVVVDEAQLFAPAAAGEVQEDARRAALAAMTNLMCRGRKRGLAGVIATQRLAKLAKNVAAEASNFLMGRTFLDIDMARAADLLGMERRQAEQIRDLERGEFLALGPAISRRPKLVRIGTVETGSRAAAPALMPLPESSASLMGDLFDAPPPPPRAVPERPSRMDVDALVPETVQETPTPETTAESEPVIVAVLRAIVAEEGPSSRETAAIYQDFRVRMRMNGMAHVEMDIAAFARRLALARIGLLSEGDIDDAWARALNLAEDLPEDMLEVFLLIASRARKGGAAPSDDEIARLYNTTSLGRIRRLLEFIEARGVIAVRKDMRGRRSFTIPALGWTTASEEPQPAAIGQLL
ncbi:ATP-binding protein [Sphingomonas sp. ID0503]|uniref:ATP-binding protein n=1 Tax=Sphingomonas sp. ID0503 TaxID=3399691 RepID=UPI003AFB0BB7